MFTCGLFCYVGWFGCSCFDLVLVYLFDIVLLFFRFFDLVMYALVLFELYCVLRVWVQLVYVWFLIIATYFSFCFGLFVCGSCLFVWVLLIVIVVLVVCFCLFCLLVTSWFVWVWFPKVCCFVIVLLFSIGLFVFGFCLLFEFVLVFKHVDLIAFRWFVSVDCFCSLRTCLWLVVCLFWLFACCLCCLICCLVFDYVLGYSVVLVVWYDYCFHLDCVWVWVWGGLDFWFVGYW